MSDLFEVPGERLRELRDAEAEVEVLREAIRKHEKVTRQTFQGATDTQWGVTRFDEELWRVLPPIPEAKRKRTPEDSDA